MIAQAARERKFFSAGRRAFLGDGQAVNWTIHREHFSTFEPILDFVHALSYVFAAALAGRPRADGFAAYACWIQAVWAGQVETILRELEARSAELGRPPEGAPKAIPGNWSSRPCDSCATPRRGCAMTRIAGRACRS